MIEATEAELAWAAGLFEGEGCIAWNRSRRTPYLCLITTDRDVLERFHEIVGVGTVYPRRFRSLKSHYKAQWVWMSGAISDVRSVTALFLPYLGKRRRARIIDVLDAYNSADVIRQPRNADQCAHGHPWNEENTWRDRRGRRQCRACNREKAAKRRLALAR